MLSRAPLGPMMILSAAFAVTVSLLVYGIYAVITLRIIDLLICAAGIYFLIRYMLGHFRSTLDFTRRSKQNGLKSIERLEGRALIEHAEEEYSAASFRFRPEVSGLSPEGFTLRCNALSPNFVFALKDNAVFEYSDIKSVGFERRENNSSLGKIRFSDTCTVMTITCTDGSSFDFYTCKGAFAESPTKDIICTNIIDTITQMNAGCRIEYEIKGKN